jgi:uncharacterized protein
VETIGFWLSYALTGFGAGFLAGLLGVGGGAIIVPALIVLFSAQGFPADYILHMTLGTSFAVIIFASISSTYAHYLREGVIWPVFWRIMGGILLGTFLGSCAAARLSSDFLKIFFSIFIFIVAVQMFLDIKPKATRKLPGALVVFIVGCLIGGVSSWVGGGGGAMSVPFLIWCNIPVRKAVGTSAAIGFPIALSGTAGYLISGLEIGVLPPLSLGFIYLPAMLFISIVSIIGAPIGVRLAHRLPTDKLKKVFAVFLSLVALKMVYGFL